MSLQHHQAKSCQVVSNNRRMLVDAFTCVHMCIVPNDGEHVQLCHDAISVNDRMNAPCFLAHSACATQDRLSALPAEITGYSLATLHKWRYYDLADGDILALQHTLNSGHRLVHAIAQIAEHTAMSALNAA